MISPRIKYMTPIRLWSTLVNHSRHRYGHHPFTVTSPSTARITRTTGAMAKRGKGWSNGIAAQVKLPSISASRLPLRRTPGLAGVRFLGIEGRLVDDAVKQLGVDRAIGRRRHRYAWLCQRGITGHVERRSRGPGLRDPAGEVSRRHRLDDKPHIGKAVAAEIRRNSGKRTDC